MADEEKIRTEEEGNTEEQKVEKSTEEIIEDEINQFKRYLDSYIPGIDSKVVDEHLEHEDYVKMIVTGLYNQYVAFMMQQQREAQSQQQNVDQRQGSQKL